MILIAIRLIDRAGHEPLLAGIAGMVLSLTVLGVSLLVATPTVESHRPSSHHYNAPLPGS